MTNLNPFYTGVPALSRIFSYHGSKWLAVGLSAVTMLVVPVLFINTFILNESHLNVSSVDGLLSSLLVSGCAKALLYIRALLLAYEIFKFVLGAIDINLLAINKWQH